MISKDELRNVFLEHGFNDEQVESIMQKRIKELLKKGEKKEISAILEVLTKNKIKKETIENCLTVLSKGKAKEIEKVLKVLDERGIKKEAIENCLYVLATGKAKEIEKVLKVLDERKIKKETIENCLTVLATGKANEIENILKVLDERGIKKEAIENCLSVLATGKAKTIEEIFNALKINNIKIEIMNSNYGWIFDKNVIFKVLEPKNKLYIKKFMILKSLYNRFIDKEEIQNICNEKGITFYELLKELNRESFDEELKETLKEKGRIYFGKSIPLSQEYMRENGEKILEIAKKAGRSFSYKYGMHDYTEIESQAIEIIVNKCGDIEYNYSKPEIIEKLIYTKTYKYLKVNLNSIKEVKTFFENERGDKRLSTIDKTKSKTEWESLNITLEQKELLTEMAQYLDIGYNLQEAIKIVADENQMDIEEIIQEIEDIKEKNKRGKEEVAR